jgi:hypothetical protein
LIAQNKVGKFSYSGFSGGMMLHSGYVWTNNFSAANSSDEQKIQGCPFGIGGLARFHFGKFFRIGGEGYSSTLVHANKGYSQLSWGGILLDCVWQNKNISPFAGFTFGGGSFKSLIASENINETIYNDNIFYRKYPLMLISPFIGMEIKLTTKMRCIVKADYIVNFTNREEDFTQGPRLYAGVIFYTQKK